MAAALKNKKKVVLITGAARGIGLATAEQLAEKGYRVYGGDISPFDPSHKNIHFGKLDITNTSSIDAFVKKIIKKEGRIDILINNAAKRLAGPVEYLAFDEVKEIMDVNFFGAFHLCQAILPYMRQQKSGHIINISSMLGVCPIPLASLYNSSKAALEALSETLSIELMPWNIAVSIIEPGHVSTNFAIKFGSKDIEGAPYQFAMEKYAKSSKKSKKWPTLQYPRQTPQSVAKFLLRVIETKKPKLRYQTSQESKKLVSIKLKDLSGHHYTKSMKAEWQKLFSKKR